MMLTLFKPAATGSYDAATTAWINAVVAAGGSVSTGRKTLVDNLIVGLKADGVWAKLDRLYLLAAENTKSALIDLVALAQATEASGPTFAIDTGYTVNGIAGIYLNYNLTTDVVHLSMNDCHFSVWNLYNGTNANALLTDSPINVFNLYPKYLNDNTYTRLNDSGGGVAIGDPRGLLVGDRITNFDRNTYQNGGFLGNVSAGTFALPNSQTVLYDGGPCAAVTLGGSLTSANHIALYNRLYNYMYNLGLTDELDPQIWAWKNAVAGTGGSISGGRMTAIRALVAGLRSDGIWDKLDRLWLLAAEDEPSALVDLVTSSRATPVGSPTFTANRGYAGNASSSYINSNFNAYSMGTKWSLNSAHLAAWDNTSRAATPASATGCYNGTQVSDIMPYYGAGVVTRINGGGLTGLTNSTSQGFFIGQRTSSSVVEGLYNGVSCGTFGDSSSAVINMPFYVCGRNDSGSLGSGLTDQISAVSYGATFTSTEALNYYNRMRTYMTHAGVP
jgi:hypothetical protein